LEEKVIKLELPIIPDPVENIATEIKNGELLIRATPPESKTNIVYYTAYIMSFKRKLVLTQTF